MNKQQTPSQFGEATLALVRRAEKLGYYVSVDQDCSLQLFAPMHGFDTREAISDFLDGVERSQRRRRT